MAVWSIVLRILLVAGLILNGSGYSVAAPHMQMAHIALPDANEHVDAGAGAPCEEHHPPAVPVSEPDCVGTGNGTMRSAPGDLPSGCCHADACGCLCINPVCGGMPALGAMATLPGGADMPWALDLGRPAPALQGVIRPPIG